MNGFTNNIGWFGALTCATTLCLALGCSADPDDPATPAPETGGAAGSGGGTPTTGGGAGTGGSTAGTGGGTTTTGGTTTLPPEPLPLIVTDHFAPSGCMGDCELGAATTTEDGCPDRAHAAAVGSCHMIEYTPLAADPAAPPPGWAGVYYQYPSNNWGTSPGLPVDAGATSVTFYARSETGGQTVTFGAGGVGDAFEPYADTITGAEIEVVLTTEWTEYTIDLTGQTYTEVLGGFVWSMGGEADHGTDLITMYIDDITWQ